MCVLHWLPGCLEINWLNNFEHALFLLLAINVSIKSGVHLSGIVCVLLHQMDSIPRTEMFSNQCLALCINSCTPYMLTHASIYNTCLPMHQYTILCNLCTYACSSVRDYVLVVPIFSMCFVLG